MLVGSSFVVLGSGFTFWVRRSGAGFLVLVRRSILPPEGGSHSSRQTKAQTGTWNQEREPGTKNLNPEPRTTNEEPTRSLLDRHRRKPARDVERRDVQVHVLADPEANSAVSYQLGPRDAQYLRAVHPERAGL